MATRIESLEWGALKVSDGHVYKDAQLWPGHSCNWDWKKTGTHHVPGIQIEDLAVFIDHVDIVILTRGMNSALQAPQATMDYITEKGKVCHVG